MDISTLQQTLGRGFGRASLVLQKRKPEIMLGLGIVGFIATVILASKASMEVGELIEDAKTDIDLLEGSRKQMTEESYPQDVYVREMAQTVVKHGLKFAKLYGPAIGTGVLSIGLVIGSHNVLNKRMLAVAGAYKLIDEAFTAYRENVVDELGEEKDLKFRYGLTEETLTEKVEDSDGKPVKVKRKQMTVPQQLTGSMYARFFDEYSLQWHKDPTLNKAFLKGQETHANSLLQLRGHLFLNEVYDMLGIPRSSEGQVVGWVRDSKTGDGFVDFGLFDGTREPVRRFVNGYESSILLDFNVDGVIYNLI